MGSSHDQAHLNTGWFQCGESLAATGSFWKDRFSPEMMGCAPFLDCTLKIRPTFPTTKAWKLRNILPRTRIQQPTGVRREDLPDLVLPVQILDYSGPSFRHDSLPTPHSPQSMNDNPTRPCCHSQDAKGSNRSGGAKLMR